MSSIAQSRTDTAITSKRIAAMRTNASHVAYHATHPEDITARKLERFIGDLVPYGPLFDAIAKGDFSRAYDLVDELMGVEAA